MRKYRYSGNMNNVSLPADIEIKSVKSKSLKKQLAEIEEVSFQNKKLEADSVKSLLFPYKNLKAVDISNNNISIFPPLPESLVALDISYNFLVTFAEIKTFTNLIEIKISNNLLERFD